MYCGVQKGHAEQLPGRACPGAAAIWAAAAAVAAVSSAFSMKRHQAGKASLPPHPTPPKNISFLSQALGELATPSAYHILTQMMSKRSWAGAHPKHTATAKHFKLSLRMQDTYSGNVHLNNCTVENGKFLVLIAGVRNINKNEMQMLQHQRQIKRTQHLFLNSDFQGSYLW